MNRLPDKLDFAKFTDSTINVLLLGEVGIGKSTFVNSFANYITFESFENAMEKPLTIFAPTTVSLLNHENDTISIPIEPPRDEFRDRKNKDTPNVKEYFIPVKDEKIIVRFIDTPGIGDSEGIDADNKILEEILLYLLKLKSLHAICFFLKPTTARSNVLFEYCMKQFLAKLENSATQNLAFIFTNARSSFYTPGDTLACLGQLFKNLKENPPFVNMPFNKTNRFCLDNEAFKYLAVMNKNIKINQNILENAAESWKISAAECKRLISYIIKLPPHLLSKTININKSKSLTSKHFQVLFEVSQMIFDNIAVMKRFEYELKMENDNFEAIKEKLCKIKKTVKMVPLPNRMVFCTSQKCVHKENLYGSTVTIFKQMCHDDPESEMKDLLSNYLRKSNEEIIARAVGKRCYACKCHTRTHKLLDSVKVIEETVDNSEVMEKCDILHQKEETLVNLQKKIFELDQECNKVIESLTKFTIFLQTNSICPVGDPFIHDIKNVIEHEEDVANDGNWNKAVSLRKLLETYKKSKLKFENELIEISAQDVSKSLRTLYTLKHNGKKIQELCERHNHSEGGVTKSEQTEVARKCHLFEKKKLSEQESAKPLKHISKDVEKSSYSSNRTQNSNKAPLSSYQTSSPQVTNNATITQQRLSANQVKTASLSLNDVPTKQPFNSDCTKIDKNTKDFGQYVNMDLEMGIPQHFNYASYFPYMTPYFGNTSQQPLNFENMQQQPLNFGHMSQQPLNYGNFPFNMSNPNAFVGPQYNTLFPPNSFSHGGSIASPHFYDSRQFMQNQSQNKPNQTPEKSDKEKSLEGSWQ